jgi:regulatory protein
MAKHQISLKARALKYLSAREHSRKELARKLSRYAQESDDIDALLDWLEAAKFLSENRFSESLVHRRATRFGNSRIFSELQSHGITSERLTEIKINLAENEILRARRVWEKKFGQTPSDTSERAKQIRFLQQRGFSLHAIKKAIALDSEGFDDD